MKKLNLLLIGLFSLIGLSSFCSSYSYTFTGTYSNSNISQYSSSLFMFPVFPYNGYYDLSYSCLFSNVVYDIENVSSVPDMNMSINYQLASSSNGITQQTNVETFSILSGLVSGTFSLRNNNTPPSYFNYINFYKSSGAVPGGLAFDYSCEFTYNVGDISTCDYSEYESTINSLSGNLATCNSNLATATGNLATCQSDLTSCQSQLPNGGSCSVSTYNSIAYSGEVSLSANSTTNAIDLGSAPNKTLCITLNGNLGNNNYVKIGFYGNTTNVASDSQEYWYDQVGKTVCMYANKRYFNINNPKSTNPTISYEAYFLNDLLSKSVPCEEGFLGYTQLQCESEYNLIPISSINSDYCENNFNLISPSNCPVCSGGVSNWSSLFINNIQHLGASNIYMTIPEEISWDYSYSNSGEIMEVDVEGYNVDYDYINNVVDIQKYKPSDEDFNNIVGILAQYMPIIVIFIGLLFLYKLLKKPFKSKL